MKRNGEIAADGLLAMTVIPALNTRWSGNTVVDWSPDQATGPIEDSTQWLVRRRRHNDSHLMR